MLETEPDFLFHNSLARYGEREVVGEVDVFRRRCQAVDEQSDVICVNFNRIEVVGFDLQKWRQIFFNTFRIFYCNVEATRCPLLDVGEVLTVFRAFGCFQEVAFCLMCYIEVFPFGVGATVFCLVCLEKLFVWHKAHYRRVLVTLLAVETSLSPANCEWQDLIGSVAVILQQNI